MAAATGAEALARLRDRPPRLCREFVRTASHPHLYNGSRAQRELGLRYTNLRAAMEATVHWYVQQGLVTRTLPRFTGQWTGDAEQPAAGEPSAGGSLFDGQAAGREQEPRP
jgi:hypothetical protein